MNSGGLISLGKHTPSEKKKKKRRRGLIQRWSFEETERKTRKQTPEDLLPPSKGRD